MIKSQEIGSAREHALALDAADPLREFRDRFVIDDDALISLDGNSLGRLPRATLARLERVRQTGRPLLITRRGVPIAQIVAPPTPESPVTGFGVMAGTVVEHGDILATLDESEWEALR